MKKILQQIPNRSFTKKKFWTSTMAMLLFFMVLGALKAQAQTQTFCPGATVSNLASTPPAGATASWFTAAAGGTALATNVALTTRTYYVEISAPVTVTTIATGFNNPTGIAVQPDGKIVFADTNNDAIKRMNADGTGIVTLGTGFLRPRGIAVQADGKIVVADTNNNLIKRMDADGTNIVILGTGFFRPWGVAIEFDGKIVVADTGNTAIKRINADGTTTTLRNFITANAIAVQIDDKIVVADASTASIRRMNLDGSNIVNVGSGFFGPNSVSVQADGKIFVADTGNNTIIRMNGDGSGITTLSTDFNFPYGVAVQSAGVIVVTDSNNNSIKRISALVSINRVPINVVVSSPVTSNFALIPAFCAGTTAPALATISPNGVAGTWSPTTISNSTSASYVFTPTLSCNTGQTLAVTVNPIPNSPTALAIQVYAGTGTIANLTATGSTIQWYTAATAGSQLPTTALLVDGSTYYASQTVSGCESVTRVAVTVRKISEATQTLCATATVANLASSPSTGNTASWFTGLSGGTALVNAAPLTAGPYYVEQSTPLTITTLGSGFFRNTSVAVQADGKILVADSNNNAIKRMDANGTNIVTLGAGFNYPSSVAVQADGKILVVDAFNDAIKRMNADGTNIVTLGSGFNLPLGVAVQADGKILITDNGNIAIKRMNADGTSIVTLGSGFSSPVGIAVQADGKILIADNGNNAIKRMNADGTNIVTLGSGFSSPDGVAVQADGKILVADTFNNTIKRMNADGSSIVTLGSGFNAPRGVAVQADGKILVGDTFNNAIKRITDAIVSNRVIVNVVLNSSVTSNFAAIPAFCAGTTAPTLATTSPNGVAGTWSPATISNTASGSYVFTPTAACNVGQTLAVTVNPVATSNFATIPAFCAGTIAPTLATTSPNDVAGTWSPATISNTTSGSYVFTATLSCNIGQTLSVTVNPVVTSNFAAISAFCAGTTAPILATTSPNGVAGTWSPATISNTASASYVFTPTGACNTGQTLAVTVNPVATSNFSTIPAFCAGTTAPILATTSLNGVAGTWSPATISNTASGNYVFTPTATCNVGQTLSVIVNPVATSNFAAIPAFCAGTTAPTLATTSPNGVAGTWSPATINNTASGSYVFTATLSCNIGQTLSVTVIPKPNPPTATATQTFYSAVASDLVASGSNLKYYNTGGLMANNAILATGNYFISQTLNSCESATTTVAVITNSTTWTGSGWSNGLPDASRGAIIAGNYVASTNLSALQLDVTGTAVMTIPTGLNLRVINAIIVSASATLIVENNSNLIQINAATNTGTVIVKRNTFMKRLDYTYWASPVASQNLFAFTPLTVTNRFLTLSESENTFVQVVSPSSTVFALAKGYSLRAPNNFLDAPALPQNFTGQFTGVPNNGDIAIPVTFTAAPTGANGYNLIGNPYPSTVIAAQFLATNTGSLYFWTHQSSYIEGVLLNGGFANYATLNLSGGVAATVLGGVNVIPNGFLQVGQGFMFKTNASKTVTFTNSMREANNGNQFFRTAASENNKLWLNLTNSNGAFSQAMIAYLPNTTTGFDDGYDAPQLNNTGLSTMIANEKYAIQSRGNFVNSDVVKLNLNTTTAGNYSFSKDNVEGIFSNSQDIFLKDNLTGTTHNIKETPYNFVATPGETANRFEIVYQSALSNNTNVFDNGNVIVFEQYGLLNLSATDDLKSVKVFDIQGRNIFELKDINAKTAVFSGFRPQQQVLLLQITNLDNKVVSKKVIF